MAIYIFNLLVGYEPCGVDNAQGYRAKMLKYLSQSVKYVFTELPRRKEFEYYGKKEIDKEKILSMHYFMAGHLRIKSSVKIGDKLKKVKEYIPQAEIVYQKDQIIMKKAGITFASFISNEKDSEYLERINYFEHGRLIRTEVYGDGIIYSESFMTAKSEEGFYAKLVRRTFYKEGGTIAYDQIFRKEKDVYLFPDGRRYSKSQFIAEFVKELNLQKSDTIILDRCAQFDFLQPLFKWGNKARFIAVIHSEHYFEKGRDYNLFYQYLNWEYNYWFKYSKMIDTMIVSTQEQKDRLIEVLQRYHCIVPNVGVIPVGGIEELKYPEQSRKPFSLISVSRLQIQKRPDWLVKSVIKAHKRNSNITLDIYGKGTFRSKLEMIIDENHAHDYIRMMGYGDVTDAYRTYEVFVTTSVWETLGLSTMEAIGSGTAVIGLDVPYGNRLFIKPEENGYLIDYDMRNVDEEKLIDILAEKILDIFEDEQRLERFHQKSYEIARGFLTEWIEEKWKKLLIGN